MAISFSKKSFDSFIKTLLLMDIRDCGKNVKSMDHDFITWSEEAAPFVKYLDLTSEYKKLVRKYKSGKIPENEMDSFSVDLKEHQEEITKNTSLDRTQVQWFKDVTLRFKKATDKRPKSKAAWNRYHNNVHYFKDPKLNALFTLEDSVKDVDIENAEKECRRIVKVVAKRNGYFLTRDEARDLANVDGKAVKNPTGIKANKKLATSYKENIKIINAVSKIAFTNYLRLSSKPMIDVNEVKKYLDGKKIVNNLPVGFVGFVDVAGHFYTTRGKKLDAVPFGQVKMNKAYDPSTDDTYYCKGIDHRKQYRTLTMSKANAEGREEVIKKFILKENENVKKWRVDLDKDGTKEQIMASMIELMYATSARIGGEKNETAGEKTYGTTTILVKFLKIHPKSIDIDYIGKKKTPQPSTFKANTKISKKVYDVIKKLVKNKKPDDKVFTYKNKDITATDLRNYFKPFGFDFSPHRLRTVAGTRMAMEILDTSTFKQGSKDCTQPKVEKWIKDEFKAIGEVLHHQSGEKVVSTTALNSYICPSVVNDFLKNLGLRSFSMWEKKHKSIESDEAEDTVRSRRSKSRVGIYE